MLTAVYPFLSNVWVFNQFHSYILTVWFFYEDKSTQSVPIMCGYVSGKYDILETLEPMG